MENTQTEQKRTNRNRRLAMIGAELPGENCKWDCLASVLLRQPKYLHLRPYRVYAYLSREGLDSRLVLVNSFGRVLHNAGVCWGSKDDLRKAVDEWYKTAQHPQFPKAWENHRNNREYSFNSLEYEWDYKTDFKVYLL